MKTIPFNEISEEFEALSFLQAAQLADTLEDKGTLISFNGEPPLHSVHIKESCQSQKDSEILNMYISELAGLSDLEAAEQNRLLKTGSESARNSVVEANLKYVPTLIKMYSQTVTVDMLQEANMALIEAALQFNDEIKCEFCAFAGVYVRRALSRLLAKQQEAENAKSMLTQRTNNAAQMLEKLKAEESEYDAQKLAKLCDIDEQTAQFVIESCADEKAAPKDNTKNRVIKVKKPKVEKELSDTTQELLGMLNEDERKVISCLFGLKTAQLSPQQTAQKLGISTQTVEKLKESALLKMKGQGTQP